MAKKLKTLTKTIEIKSGTFVCPDGVEIGHNSFVSITDSLLRTANGLLDQENGTGQRIGDKITLQGMSIKCMLEFNERYSDVTFRTLLIRSAKGDVPSACTLWTNASANRVSTFGLHADGLKKCSGALRACNSIFTISIIPIIVLGSNIVVVLPGTHLSA